MASSINDSSLAPLISYRRYQYDVFVTYCGIDTRGSFTALLFDALETKGISVFRDETINFEEDESIETESIRAIQRSQIFVAVFSRHYAFSSLSLRELEYICECARVPGKHVFPVFYDVSPTEVQKQSGIYGEAFAKHEQRFQHDPLAVSRWRGALSQVASIPGWDLRERDRLATISNIVEQVYTRVDRVRLHNISDVVPGDSRTSRWGFNADTAWRVVGLMSSGAGLSCYALSPSFNRLFGRWKPFKYFLYGVLCVGIVTFIFKAKKLSYSTQHARLIKTCAIFAVYISISVYSFFYDRAVNGHPDILSVFSNAAFALLSLSLHKLFEFESDVGIFSYFLCCFTVQVLTINWMLVFFAIIYGCVLLVMHSSLNSETEVASKGHAIPSSNSDLAVRSSDECVINMPSEASLRSDAEL